MSHSDIDADRDVADAIARQLTKQELDVRAISNLHEIDATDVKACEVVYAVKSFGDDDQGSVERESDNG